MTHAEQASFWGKYIFSVDHKVIGKQFLWTGLLFLAFGGALAMLIRWQWAHPGAPVPALGWLLHESGGSLTPESYQTVFTTHGLIMIFFAVTPILIGAFGNFLIPLLIGARDMAFPRLNMYSFWTFALSAALMVASFFTELGSASAGWTSYPPLSTRIGTPQLGQTLVLLAIFVTGLSSIMGGVNYVTTVIRCRAPGMHFFRMPLSVWGLWLTAILNVLFVPVLGVAALLLLMDRELGTQFFLATPGTGVTEVTGSARGAGDPLLFQHLFWIFGHPEVYILILPAWGFVSDFLSYFARKPAYWYRGTVYAFLAVTVLSALVYGHHMFVSGMSPLLGRSFMLLTLLVSVPAEVFFLNWLQTLWRGSIRLTSPMLFALGTVFVFGLGGLTGLYLGTVAIDIYLHDTLFVVGHFHLTMAAATFMAGFAAIHFWFPKMFGRMLSEPLAKLHFWLTSITLTLVFSGQLLAGYSGQQRRLYDPFQYVYLEHLQPLNQWTSYAAFVLGAAQLLFVFNVFYSLFRGKKAERNPWEVGTLEWTHAASPPAGHNFDDIPVVLRGPHELAHPGARKWLGRDWLGQAEVLPDEVENEAKVLAPQGAGR